jgi:dTMP kinase
MFIVIDGIDGSGKSTQLDLLPYTKINFPNYTSDTGKLIRKYLDGELPLDVYSASLLYALDRKCFDFPDLNGNVNSNSNGIAKPDNSLPLNEVNLNGNVNSNLNGIATPSSNHIISGRYTSSNIIHQMSRLPKSDWNGYIDWLLDLEYEKMKIRRPDSVIFLDIDPEISRAHMIGRTLDIHEQNLDYQKTCRESGLYAAEKLNWQIIPVTTIEDTNKKIVNYLKGN